MINKDEVKKDLKIFWSDEDNCYIATHPLYDRVSGIGETENEAEETLFNLLEDFMPYFLAGKVVNKGGRPKKNNSKLTYNVPTEIKTFIELESMKLGITQGVFIENLVKSYKEQLT